MPLKDPVARAAYHKAYHAAHRDESAAQSKAYRAAHPDESRARGAAWRAANREYHNAYERARYAANRGEIREKQRAYAAGRGPENKRRNRVYNLSRYGLTSETYRDHLVGQAGRCLICLRVPKRDMAIDHDHKTGVFRGLLCQQCNTAIGLLGEDRARFQRAAAYVR